jgi:hypothetical protein
VPGGDYAPQTRKMNGSAIRIRNLFRHGKHAHPIIVSLISLASIRKFLPCFINLAFTFIQILFIL